MTVRDTRPLNAKLDCRRAFQHFARQCVAELQQREASARRGKADAIHRMRIALTKLRAVRKFFAVMARDGTWPGLKRDVRWLNAALGAARDSDVATGYSESKSFRSTAATRKIVRQDVTDSHRRLTRVLSSPRYKRFIAALLHWIEAGPWVAGQAAAARKRRMQPLAEFGAVRLAGWRKQLGGEADKLSTEKQRHRVRIETKRYRYMSEALKTLGVPESDKQARARKAAERVQSILGDLRDVRRFRRKYAQRSPDHHAHRRNEKLLQEAAKLLRQLAR